MKYDKMNSKWLILIFLLFVNIKTYAQDFLMDFPEVAEGAVNSMARSGDTLYIGGSFKRILSPDSSGRHFAAIDRQTGAVIGTWPKFNGTIVKMVADGKGGFFVGGDFTMAGSIPRDRIAHLDSTGKVTNLLAGISVNDFVTSLAYIGDTLFIAGRFTKVSGQARNILAAVRVSTGEVLPWNPTMQGTHIYNLVLHGNKLYVSGYFSGAAGQIRNNLAAFDRVSGNITAWNPNPDKWVHSMITHGNRVILGGRFTAVGGIARQHIAAVDTVTGALHGWNPGVTGSYAPYIDGWVLTMTRIGDTLYIGGSFDSVAGQPRVNLAAINIITGQLTAWAPKSYTKYASRALNGDVFSLVAHEGLIYAGGNFHFINTDSREYAATIDGRTGLPTSWKVSMDEAVHSFIIKKDLVFAGGGFMRAGGMERKYLAAIDLKTGFVTSWNPTANDTVSAVCIYENSVVVGGAFSQAGGQSRNRIASLHKVTGIAEIWNPGANGSVYALSTKGNILYMGGLFTNIGGQTRNRLAAVNLNTATVLPWNPGTNGMVGSIAVSGNTVYAGGYFTQAATQSRSRLAAFDAVTGALKTWNPNPNNEVYGLAVNEEKLYVGGFFTNIAGQPRNYLAAFDTTSGGITSWNPDADYLVSSFSFDQNNVYASGGFSQMDSIKTSIAKINKTTGAVLDWGYELLYKNTSEWGVFTSLVHDGILYVGGGISGIKPASNNQFKFGLNAFVINPADTLYTDLDTIRAATHGGLFPLSVFTNGQWVLTGVPAWIKPSVQNGNGNAVIVLSVDTNASQSSRSQVLTFIMDSLVKQVVLIQDRDSSTLNTDQDTLFIPASGGQFPLTVISNRSWILDTTATWISPSHQSGNGNVTVTFSVDSNNGSVRSDILKFVAGNLMKQVILLQDSNRVNTGLSIVSETSLKIYPNPSSGLVTIEGLATHGYYVEIYSFDGKLLMKQPLVNSMTIDLSASGKGLYLLRLQHEEGTVSVVESVMIE